MRPKSSPDINYEDIISRNTPRCQVAFLMVALHRLDFWYGKPVVGLLDGGQITTT